MLELLALTWSNMKLNYIRKEQFGCVSAVANITEAEYLEILFTLGQTVLAAWQISQNRTKRERGGRDSKSRNTIDSKYTANILNGLNAWYWRTHYNFKCMQISIHKVIFYLDFIRELSNASVIYLLQSHMLKQPRNVRSPGLHCTWPNLYKVQYSYLLFRVWKLTLKWLNYLTF